MIWRQEKTKPSHHRKVIGRGATVDIIMQNLGFINFRSSRCEHIIDLLTRASSLKTIECADVTYIGMFHAKRIDHRNGIRMFPFSSPAEPRVSFQKRDNGVAFTHVKIAG